MEDTSEGHSQLSNPNKILTFRQLLGLEELKGSEVADSSSLIPSEDVNLSPPEEDRLQRAGRGIRWHSHHSGFGYLSSSTIHDKPKERYAADYIAHCFSSKEPPDIPVIVSVEELYKFIPGSPSMVTKTQTLNGIVSEKYPGKNFALILTGFSDSEIFTQKILEEIPNQENAGLDITGQTQFGRELFAFAKSSLPLIIEKEKGDLNSAINRIAKGNSNEEEGAKLLLVTGLLLQDIQRWQGLWYESAHSGTPLYIVAPSSYHNAMNRLTEAWGHGGFDYYDRAMSSLGGIDESFLGEIDSTSFQKQGLSADEFERRITPLLRTITQGTG